MPSRRTSPGRLRHGCAACPVSNCVSYEANWPLACRDGDVVVASPPAPDRRASDLTPGTPSNTGVADPSTNRGRMTLPYDRRRSTGRPGSSALCVHMTMAWHVAMLPTIPNPIAAERRPTGLHWFQPSLYPVNGYDAVTTRAFAPVPSTKRVVDVLEQTSPFGPSMRRYT